MLKFEVYTKRSIVPWFTLCEVFLPSCPVVKIYMYRPARCENQTQIYLNAPSSRVVLHPLSRPVPSRSINSIVICFYRRVCQTPPPNKSNHYRPVPSQLLHTVKGLGNRRWNFPLVSPVIPTLGASQCIKWAFPTLESFAATNTQTHRHRSV